MKKLLLALLFPLVLYAQEEEPEVADMEMTEPELIFSYKGFVDTYHAVRSSGDWDYMANRTRVRLEGGLEKGSASAFISLNTTHNALLNDLTGVTLREAFLNWQENGWEIKVGRQIICWGVADGIRITDQISPMDYTEFLAQDYDDIRVPVNALRLGYGTSDFHIEGVFIPKSDFFILPTDRNNPWAVSVSGIPCNINDLQPGNKLKNSEFGARMTCYLSGIDFSLCALRTWNKMPALRPVDISDEYISVDACYDRMTMLGGDVSIPLDKFVFRGEFAENLDELLSTRSGSPENANTANALVGVDWYPGDDWTVMAQYSHCYISNYTPRFSNYRNSGMASINIKKELLRNTLKLSAFGRFDCSNEGAFFIRFAGDYLLTDQITLTAGYDWFDAHAGSFAMYNKNSEIFAKAKFSF